MVSMNEIVNGAMTSSLQTRLFSYSFSLIVICGKNKVKEHEKDNPLLKFE